MYVVVQANECVGLATYCPDGLLGTYHQGKHLRIAICVVRGEVATTNLPRSKEFWRQVCKRTKPITRGFGKFLASSCPYFVECGFQIRLGIVRSAQGYEFIVKPTLTAKSLGKNFKVSGGAVKLTKNNKSIQFIFEVFRREENWKNKLVQKMKLYKDFYENFVPGDSGFSSIPQLIFVCEDEKHMMECFKEIVVNKLELPNIEMLFTTDLKQNSESLEKSLTTFKLVDGKYKMQEVDLKLLSNE